MKKSEIQICEYKKYIKVFSTRQWYKKLRQWDILGSKNCT